MTESNVIVSCEGCGSINGAHDLNCTNSPANLKHAGVSYRTIDTSASPQVDFPRILGEIRSVSSTGGEKGVKPQAHSYLPRKALDVISEVYSFGAKKYSAHNWRKGYEWSKSYDALQRHLTAWWDREENDPESGLSHLGHAGFHIFALIVFAGDRKKYGEFDDRYQDKVTITINLPQNDPIEALKDSNRTLRRLKTTLE